MRIPPDNQLLFHTYEAIAAELACGVRLGALIIGDDFTSAEAIGREIASCLRQAGIATALRGPVNGWRHFYALSANEASLEAFNANDPVIIADRITHVVLVADSTSINREALLPPLSGSPVIRWVRPSTVLAASLAAVR